MEEFRRPDSLSMPTRRLRLPLLDGEPVFVEGELFSGIGYVPGELDWSYRPVRIVDGVAQDELDDPLFGDRLVFELEAQPDFTEGADTLNGERFNGLSIMFSNSDGVRTISFVGDGEPIDSYLFHDSGTVQSRRVRLDWEPRHHSNFGATFQSQAWSVDGTCRQVSTQFSFPESSTRDHPNGRYSVSASGVVDVAFRGGYFELTEQFSAYLVLPYLRDFEFIDTLFSTLETPAEKFRLTFGERSVELVEKLQSAGAFQDVKNLKVGASDKAGLDVLCAAELPALQQLQVRMPSHSRDHLASFMTVLAFKRKRPDVEVHYESWGLYLSGEILTPRSQLSYGLFFDDNFEDLIGVRRFGRDLSPLVDLIVESPSLRFVSFERDRDLEGVEDLIPRLKSRPEVIVYGPDVPRGDWPKIVWRQLIADGVVTDPG